MIHDIDDWREHPTIQAQDTEFWLRLTALALAGILALGVWLGVAGIGHQLDIVDASIERHVVPMLYHAPPPTSGTISCDCRVVP